MIETARRWQVILKAIWGFETVSFRPSAVASLNGIGSLSISSCPTPVAGVVSPCETDALREPEGRSVFVRRDVTRLGARVQELPPAYHLFKSSGALSRLHETMEELPVTKLPVGSGW
jgi:hypothetical protein